MQDSLTEAPPVQSGISSIELSDVIDPAGHEWCHVPTETASNETWFQAGSDPVERYHKVMVPPEGFATLFNPGGKRIPASRVVLPPNVQVVGDDLYVLFPRAWRNDDPDVDGLQRPERPSKFYALVSADGLDFVMRMDPVFDHPSARAGVEDVRLNTTLMACVATQPFGHESKVHARIAVAPLSDTLYLNNGDTHKYFDGFDIVRIVDSHGRDVNLLDNKDPVPLHNGLLIHRPRGQYIAVARRSTHDKLEYDDLELLIGPGPGMLKVGGGTAVVRDDGLLELYFHSVKQAGQSNVYENWVALYAIQDDPHEPLKLVGITQKPIMTPTTDYEINGIGGALHASALIVNTVIPTDDGYRMFYYGCADRCTGIARIHERELDMLIRPIESVDLNCLPFTLAHNPVRPYFMPKIDLTPKS